MGIAASGAGRYKISHLQQYLSVVGYAKTTLPDKFQHKFHTFRK